VQSNDPGPNYRLAVELLGISGDYNDNDVSIYPGAPEICNDGIDQDCNGTDLKCIPDITFQEIKFIPGKPCTIIAYIRGLSVKNVQLHYRVGGSLSEYTLVPMAVTGIPWIRWSYTIPSKYVTTAGIEYYLRVEDIYGVIEETYPMKTEEIVPTLGEWGLIISFSLFCGIFGGHFRKRFVVEVAV